MVFPGLLAPDDQRVSPSLADEHDDDHLSLSTAVHAMVNKL